MGVPSVLESPQDFRVLKPLVLKTFNHDLPKRPLALMDPNVNAGNSPDESDGNDGRKRGGYDVHGRGDGVGGVVDDVDDMPPLVDNPFPSTIVHPSAPFATQGMSPYPHALRSPMPQTPPGQPYSQSAASPRGVTPVQYTFAMNLTPSAYAPHVPSDGGGGAGWHAPGTTGANDVNLDLTSGAGSPMSADSRFRRTDAFLPSGMTMAMMPESDDGDEDDDMPPLVDRPPEPEANPWNSSQRFADNDFANPIAKHHSDLMDEDDEDEDVESNTLSFNSSFASPMRSPSSPATSPSYSVSPGQAAGVGPGGYSFSHQFPASPPGLEAKPNFSFEMAAPGGNGNNSNASKKNAARPASYIPRPPNAFILFRASFVRAHSANASGGASASVPMSTSVSGSHRMPSPQRGSGPVGVATGSSNSNTMGVASTNLSKLAGQAWRALPASEREVWERKALAAQAEHRKKYPDWRFRPGNVSGLQIRDGGGGGSGSGSGDPGGGGGKDAKEKGSPSKAQNRGQESKDRRSPGAATTSSSGSSSKKRARNANFPPGSPTTHHIGSFSSSPRALDRDIETTAPPATESSNTTSPTGRRSPGGAKKRSRTSSDASTTSNISAASNASAGSNNSARSAKRSRNSSLDSVASASKASNERSSPSPSSPPASSLASSSTIKAEAQQPFLSSPSFSNVSAPPEPTTSSFRSILEHQSQSSPIAPSMLFDHYPPVRRSPALAQSLSRGGSPLDTPIVPPLPMHPSDGITPMQRNSATNEMGSSTPPAVVSSFAEFPVQGGAGLSQTQIQQAPSPIPSRFEATIDYPSSVLVNGSPQPLSPTLAAFPNSTAFDNISDLANLGNSNGNPDEGETPAMAPTSTISQNQRPHISTYSTLEGWAGGMSPVLPQNSFAFGSEPAHVSQHSQAYQSSAMWYDAPAYDNMSSGSSATAPASSSAVGAQRQLGISANSPSAEQQAHVHSVYPEMRQEDQYAFLSDATTYLLQDYYPSLESGGLQHPQK